MNQHSFLICTTVLLLLHTRVWARQAVPRQPLSDSTPSSYVDFNFLFNVNGLWYNPADVNYVLKKLPVEYIVDCTRDQPQHVQCKVAEPEDTALPHGPHRDVQGWLQQTSLPIHVASGIACASDYGSSRIRARLRCVRIPGETPWDPAAYDARNCTVYFYSAFNDAMLMLYFLLWFFTVAAEVSIWVVGWCTRERDGVAGSHLKFFRGGLYKQPCWIILMWAPALLTFCHTVLQMDSAQNYSCDETYSIDAEIGMAVLVFVGGMVVLCITTACRYLSFLLSADKQL